MYPFAYNYAIFTLYLVTIKISKQIYNHMYEYLIPAVRRKCNKKKRQPHAQSIRVRNFVNYIIVSKKPFMYYENVVLIKFVIYV